VTHSLFLFGNTVLLGFVYVSSSLRVRVWCALDVTSFVFVFVRAIVRRFGV
jgi:hypothetical protein